VRRWHADPFGFLRLAARRDRAWSDAEILCRWSQPPRLA
jgi:hypothetical protein